MRRTLVMTLLLLLPYLTVGQTQEQQEKAKTVGNRIQSEVIRNGRSVRIAAKWCALRMSESTHCLRAVIAERC